MNIVLIVLSWKCCEVHFSEYSQSWSENSTVLLLDAHDSDMSSAIFFLSAHLGCWRWFSDIDEPITASGNRETSSAVLVNESDVETLVAFGFLPEMARKALRATVGDVGLLFICVIDVLPSFRI